MANETEIERLVVRLVGDDQGYKTMIQNASTLTDKLGHAIGGVTSISQGLGGSLGSVFSLIQRFGPSGAIIGGLVTAASVTLNRLGNETRDAARAQEAYQEAMRKGIEASNQSVQGNIFMTYQRNLREATEFTKSKWDEMRKAQADSLEAQRQLMSLQPMEQTRLQKGWYDPTKGKWENVMNQPIVKDLSARFWEGRTAQESLNDRQVQERVTAQQKVNSAEAKLEESTVALTEQLINEAKSRYESILVGDRYIDTVDRNIEAHESERQFAEALTDQYRGMIQQSATLGKEFYVRPGHELEDQFKKQFAGQSQLMGVQPSAQLNLAQRVMSSTFQYMDRNRLEESHFFQMQVLQNKESVAGIRSPMERAGEEAFRMERYRGKTTEQAEEVRKSMERISLGGQKLAFNEQMRDAVINIDYFDQELKANLITMNEEKQIAIEAAKAFELWKRANVDLVATEGERQKAVLRSNAAQQVALIYAKEGLSLQERWMLPQDRALRNMERMQKIDEVGGFGKGLAGQWVKQEAMAEAYAQAHRYYTSMRLGQSYEAIGGPQGDTARALREYALGSQMIPEEQLKAAGVAMKAKDEDMPKDVKDMAEGIRELVGLVRENKRPMVDFAIGVANFAGGVL